MLFISDLFLSSFPFIRLPNTSHLCLFRHLFFCALFLRCPITPFYSMYTLIAAWSFSITSPKSSILALITFFMPHPSIHTWPSVNVFSYVYHVDSFNPSQTQFKICIPILLMLSFILRPFSFSQPSSTHIWPFRSPPIIIPMPSSRALKTTPLMYSNFMMFSSLRTPSQIMYTLPTSHSNLWSLRPIFYKAYIFHLVYHFFTSNLFVNNEPCTTRPPFRPLSICIIP